MQDIYPPGGLREAVAEVIRVELARRKMTQRSLADATGLSQSYIGRRMTGEQPFDVDDLALIAAALEIAVADLLPSADRSGVAA